MEITVGTPITSNFGSTINNSGMLAGLTLAVGNLAILTIQVRIQAGVTLPPAAPMWGAQTFSLVSNLEDNAGSPESRKLTYTLIAATSATNSVTFGFDQYIVFSAAVTPFAGTINTSTPIGTVFSQSRWASSGYLAPSLNVTDSTAGDLIWSDLGSVGVATV